MQEELRRLQATVRHSGPVLPHVQGTISLVEQLAVLDQHRADQEAESVLVILPKLADPALDLHLLTRVAPVPHTARPQVNQAQVLALLTNPRAILPTAPINPQRVARYQAR